MHNAFLFPGQGSQYVGMGQDFYNNSNYAKELYNLASEILGFNLEKISFDGPDDILKETQYTQPAIFVCSIIVDQFLKNKGISPDAVAGHSLGEFSALVSAGVLTFEDALQIVKLRSSEMAIAGQNSPGAMAAILGADDKHLDIICNQNGIVVPANMNAPGQTVISGEIEAVNKAIQSAKELGIKRAIALNVSGAFHSPLMASAREPLNSLMDSINFKNANIPVFQNVSASPITKAKAIRENLLNQLEKPVLWFETILNLKYMGISKFYEVGPGKVLKGLNRRIYPESTTITCELLENIEETCESI